MAPFQFVGNPSESLLDQVITIIDPLQNPEPSRPRPTVPVPDQEATLFSIVTDPELRRASTDRAAMTAAATAASGLDVAAFLAPWLDTEAVPQLGVRWRPADGGTLVEVTQHQDGPFFPLTVPVRVHAGAERRDLRLRMDTILAGALVATTAAVDSVVLDPDGWPLFRTADSPPPRLLAAQLLAALAIGRHLRQRPLGFDLD